MAETTVLICTVGGSHEPIVTAVKSLSPDHVVFLCSQDDAATGRKGSHTQIESAGSCIKAKPDDAAPTLPNIPTQTGLATGSFSVECVSPDDLEHAVGAILACLWRLAADFPGARRVADYTGGTKTMSAALVTAALEFGGVELQLVTGSRANLIAVRSGSEQAALISVGGLRLARIIDQHLSAWSNHEYAVAASGLERCAPPADSGLRAKLNRARDLSRAFAAWDCFDHASACAGLEVYAGIVAQDLGTAYHALKILAGHDSPKREGLRIWDLWLNALRRARASRHDDAVARVYRLLEWTAQWVLKRDAGFDTADLPADRVPAGLIPPNRDGKYQAGLYAAWRLVRELTTGPAAVFFAEHEFAMLDHLKIRNLSILAHGYAPVTKISWDKLQSWLESAFIPTLQAELKSVGIKEPFHQLPHRYLWNG